MIQLVQIVRFRGIRKGAIDDFAPLTVLVGPNGSGKSSLLEALRIGAAKDPQAAFREVAERHQHMLHTSRWLIWRGVASSDARLVVASRTTGDHRICTLHAGLNSKVRVEVSERAKVPAEKALAGPAVRSFAAPDDSIEALEGVPEVRWVELPLVTASRPLHSLYSQTVEQGRVRQAKEIITQVVPKLQNLEILTEEDRPVLHLVFEAGSIPVALAGDGVNALVRICLELASLPGGVVLIEEPELHQHPAAIRQTAKAVLAAVRRDIQVILSTHSLEFIDALLAEAGEDDNDLLAVFRLSLENGLLQSRRIPGQEAALLRGEIESDLR